MNTPLQIAALLHLVGFNPQARELRVGFRLVIPVTPDDETAPSCGVRIPHVFLNTGKYSRKKFYVTSI